MTLDKRFYNPQAPDRQAHAMLACQQPSPDKSGSYARPPCSLFAQLCERR